MGFVSEILSNENGIQWYYIIGLFIFLSLFIIMIYRVIKIPKNELKQFKESIFTNDSAIDKN